MTRPSGHVDRQRDRRLLQHRPQAGDDLVGRLAEAELPALGMRAVDRDLLEGLDQLAGAMQVGHQLLGGVARAPDEFLELASGASAPSDFSSASNISARRAKLDATVRLMPIGLLTSWATPATRPPSAASRSASIRFCWAVLQLEQRALGLFLGGAQLVLGLALGDGVFAEHLDRARHRADLVAGAGALDLPVVVARGDRLHRRHDLLQRQPDARARSARRR